MANKSFEFVDLITSWINYELLKPNVKISIFLMNELSKAKHWFMTLNRKWDGMMMSSAVCILNTCSSLLTSRFRSVDDNGYGVKVND